MFKTLIALWRIIKWLRAEKKQMEADVDGYLTQERALAWRLSLEKIFRGLDTGYPHMKEIWNVPRPIRWLFSQTTADNRVGEFGMWFLKSKKIEDGDSVLSQPIKPYQTH